MLPNKECVGCSACIEICPVNCIAEVQSEEGFYYPRINKLRCIGCKKCEAVCPVLKAKETAADEKSRPKAFGAISTDSETRRNSSSGGLFAELARHIFSQNGVVYGTAYHEGQCRIERITAMEELPRLQGSKYIQSRTNDSYLAVRRDLEDNRKVLFSGTPCQVAGLLQFLNKPYANLVTIDLVCHGVGSPKALSAYLNELCGRKHSAVKSLAFRDKSTGWKNYSVSVRFENESIERTSFSENQFMKAYLSNLCLRQSCHNCSFKSINRRSDITLADYWGLQKSHPEFDDDLGCSFVLLHSKAGEDMFNSIASELVFFDAEAEDLVRYNPAYVRSVVPHHFREYFFSRLGKGSFSKLVSDCLKPSFAVRLQRKARELLKHKQ